MVSGDSVAKRCFLGSSYLNNKVGSARNLALFQSNLFAGQLSRVFSEIAVSLAGDVFVTGRSGARLSRSVGPDSTL